MWVSARCIQCSECRCYASELRITLHPSQHYLTRLFLPRTIRPSPQCAVKEMPLLRTFLGENTWYWTTSLFLLRPIGANLHFPAGVFIRASVLAGTNTWISSLTYVWKSYVSLTLPGCKYKVSNPEDCRERISSWDYVKVDMGDTLLWERSCIVKSLSQGATNYRIRTHRTMAPFPKGNT